MIILEAANIPAYYDETNKQIKFHDGAKDHMVANFEKAIFVRFKKTSGFEFSSSFLQTNVKEDADCVVTMIPEFTYDGEKVKNAQLGWNWCESTVMENCNRVPLDSSKCKAIPPTTTTTTAATTTTTATTTTEAVSATTRKPDADSSTNGGIPEHY